MNLLQIWTGNTLPSRELSCVLRAKLIYPDSHYTLITDDPTTWPFKPDKVILKKDYDKVIMERCGMELSAPVSFSDYARFVYLSQHENTLYLDCDTYCISPMKDMKENGIWFYDIFAIYGGNDLEEMNKALDARVHGAAILPICGEKLAETAVKINEYFSHGGICSHDH